MTGIVDVTIQSLRNCEGTEQLLVDMHAHLACFTKEYEAVGGDAEMNLRRQNHITTCFSTGTPGEWKALQPFCRRGEIIVSFGIHPWYADCYETEECREYLELCDFVGEIGMDSVWCEIPLKLQQRRLEEQLQIAADMGKPVLLHTKGQEDRIADIIKGFPGKVCVHWYSGAEEGLEKFLDQDCYFTLGPDTAWERGENRKLIRKMVTEIPADRLFLETDGISAVAWAMGKEYVDIREIPLVLKRNLEYAARSKEMTEDALAVQMQDNLRRWFGCMETPEIPGKKITFTS